MELPLQLISISLFRGHFTLFLSNSTEIPPPLTQIQNKPPSNPILQNKPLINPTLQNNSPTPASNISNDIYLFYSVNCAST